VSTSDVYLSADIEADGPIPGEYSMLSFGFSVAGRYDGATFRRANPEEQTFYRELRPISDKFDPQATAAAHLDRRALMLQGEDPAGAMQSAHAWVKQVAAGERPVLVAYPLGFDWMFLYYYFVRFAGASPFGFSSCLDMKTMYVAKSGKRVTQATKSQMPRSLRSGRRHTHNALDDAIEQADLFANLFEWHGRTRSSGALPPEDGNELPAGVP
jgi:hypothetical protein